MGLAVVVVGIDEKGDIGWGESGFEMATFADDGPTVHCSMLAEDAIKSAISNYYTKNPNARSTNLAGTGAAMPKVESTASQMAPV